MFGAQFGAVTGWCVPEGHVTVTPDDTTQCTTSEVANDCACLHINCMSVKCPLCFICLKSSRATLDAQIVPSSVPQVCTDPHWLRSPGLSSPAQHINSLVQSFCQFLLVCLF